MGRRSIIAMALLAGACGSEAPPPTSAPPSSVVTPAPTSTTTATATATAAYELHEWGVIDVGSSGVVHLTSGPERRIRAVPRPTMGFRAPVVYAHLLDGADAVSFALRIALPTGGEVLEHAPSATIAGATLSWPAVTAHAAHCPTAAQRVPTGEPGGPSPCTTADHVCELAELPNYDADSAACLEVEGDRAGLLFYRASVPSLTLPLTVSRRDDGTILVTATSGSLDEIPGLLRITHPAGTEPGTLRIAQREAPVSDGVTIAMPTEAIDRASSIDALRAMLRGLGMDADEANAFTTAWECELFGVDPSVAHHPSALHPLDDALLYFVPQSAVDALWRLDATPTPRAIRRAFLVRVDLGANE
jgi:hypothetical protein